MPDSNSNTPSFPTKETRATPKHKAKLKELVDSLIPAAEKEFCTEEESEMAGVVNVFCTPGEDIHRVIDTLKELGYTIPSIAVWCPSVMTAEDQLRGELEASGFLVTATNICDFVRRKGEGPPRQLIEVNEAEAREYREWEKRNRPTLEERRQEILDRAERRKTPGTEEYESKYRTLEMIVEGLEEMDHALDGLPEGLTLGEAFELKRIDEKLTVEAVERFLSE